MGTTPVSAVLPAAADDQSLVQLRILTTNAVGQDEWVGVEDIEVEASGAVCGPVPPVPPVSPGPVPPVAGPPPSQDPPGPPAATRLTLSDLTLSPRRFRAARKGAAVSRTGRAGASLRFRLSGSATVVFRVLDARSPGPPRARTPLVSRAIGQFSIRGRKGLNRLRFTGRLRGRAQAPGPYRLTAQAIGHDGLASAQESIGYEVLRAVRRAGDDDPELPAELLLERAGALRDAIHVVSAHDLHPIGAFLTYDERHAAAARLAGLRTTAPRGG